MDNTWTNKLYYGDNLGIMRDYIADESVGRQLQAPGTFVRARRKVKSKGEGQKRLLLQTDT